MLMLKLSSRYDCHADALRLILINMFSMMVLRRLKWTLQRGWMISTSFIRESLARADWSKYVFILILFHNCPAQNISHKILKLFHVMLKIALTKSQIHLTLIYIWYFSSLNNLVLSQIFSTTSQIFSHKFRRYLSNNLIRFRSVDPRQLAKLDRLLTEVFLDHNYYCCKQIFLMMMPTIMMRMAMSRYVSASGNPADTNIIIIIIIIMTIMMIVRRLWLWWWWC